MKKLFAVTLSVLALASLPARADVVPPEPEACLPGSTPSTCHGGAHCRAQKCETDTNCTGGAVCKEITACVRTVNCAGNIAPEDDARAYDQDALEGNCPASGTCAAGTCQSIRVCVQADTSTATATTTSSTSTATATTTSSTSTGASTSTGTDSTATATSTDSASGGKSSGCGCVVGGRGGAGLLALTFGLGVLLIRRRRS